MIDNKTIRKVIMLNKCLKGGSPTYENREAEGAVANFETNTVQPFVKCECTIDATESGTDELTLTRTGKNLFDDSNITPNSYMNSDGSQVTGSAASGWSSSDFISIKGGENYYFQPNTTAGGTAKGCFYDSEKNFISSFNSGAIALTSPSNACFVCFSFRSASTDIQLELGSTATTYEPYTVSTYTVALEETAYGGSVDVIAGNGRIIDEHGDLVYTLFEPVSISALEGVNNVWTDSGDTKVTYKYKTGEGGSSTKKYLPIFYDFYGKDCRHL